MPDAPLLSVRGLNAWYGESHILHGVEFDVPRGEVVTLLGRNGAGKTTTLKSIMGMVARRKGSVRFEGTEAIALSSDRIARLGVAFCPEERGIFASLNVHENLLLPPAVRPGGLTVEQVFEPGHQALRRRAADARDRPHSAHRGAAAAARRADRGPRAGDRAADRPHHRAPEARGLHDAAGRAEFPLRADGRRPPLHRRAGARRRHGAERS